MNRFFAYTGFLLLLSSCNTFDPPVVVPAYGHVDNMPLSTDYNVQGTNSADILDAWVYLDDNPIGAFQMPCTFPMILSAGQHTVSIYPGIIQDGIADMPAIYTFYKYYDTTLTLNPNTTYSFKPKTTYNTWVVFGLMENFDESGFPAKITNGPGTDTTMFITKNKADVFQGDVGSGIVVVSTNYPVYVGVTDPISFPSSSSGDPVYMEMNYKTTAQFQVGIYSGVTSNNVPATYTPILYVNPASTWQKMYVNLQSTVNSGLIAPLCVCFEMNLNPSHSTDTLLLDNIKVLW